MHVMSDIQQRDNPVWFHGEVTDLLKQYSNTSLILNHKGIYHPEQTCLWGNSRKKKKPQDETERKQSQAKLEEKRVSVLPNIVACTPKKTETCSLDTGQP